MRIPKPTANYHDAMAFHRAAAKKLRALDALTPRTLEALGRLHAWAVTHREDARDRAARRRR